MQQKAVDVHNETAKKSAEMRAKSSFLSTFPDYSAKELQNLTTDLEKMKSRTL